MLGPTEEDIEDASELRTINISLLAVLVGAPFLLGLIFFGLHLKSKHSAEQSLQNSSLLAN